MRHSHRLPASVSAPLATLAVLAALVAPLPLDAASTVSVLSPPAVDAAILGYAVEDFEDLSLVSGVSIRFATWRNGSNVITADAPVVYTGTLPVTWAPTSDGISNNPWDGTRALVNGWGHNWAYPYAASVQFTFSPPQPVVGVGCSNFQGDITAHELIVNGVSKGNLEALTGWVDTIVHGKNGYLMISGEPISTIEFRANTHYDGLVFDRLALASGPTPTLSTTWGRVKSLYR